MLEWIEKYQSWNGEKVRRKKDYKNTKNKIKELKLKQDNIQRNR